MRLHSPTKLAFFNPLLAKSSIQGCNHTFTLFRGYFSSHPFPPFPFFLPFSLPFLFPSYFQPQNGPLNPAKGCGRVLLASHSKERTTSAAIMHVLGALDTLKRVLKWSILWPTPYNHRLRIQLSRVCLGGLVS